MKKRKILTKAYRILLVFLLTASCLALGSQAVVAATMPAYTSLGTVADTADDPTTIGIDSQGRLYVGGDEKVKIFTQSGYYQATIRPNGYPNTIAIDSAGKIYVGTSDTGTVTVYGPDLQSLGILGNGTAPNFGVYFDVAVDNGGNVYVADKASDAVHVFNSTTRDLVTSLTALGPATALHHPVSVTVDENASELIVLDRQLTPDLRSIDPWIDGIGVHVFKIGVDATAGTTTWTWDRSFGTFGDNRAAGDIKVPAEIAVDGQSRIYVLENLVNPVAMVFSDIGEYLGNIQVPGRNDMAISSANLMYVVNYKRSKSTINVYGLDSFSAAVVAPSPIKYQATVGGNTPQAQSITLENLGTTDLDWSVSSDAPWIGMADATGTLLAPVDPDTSSTSLEIPVVLDGLAAGSYDGTVSVMTAGGVTDQVSVTLTIAPNPLVVTPASIPLNSTVGTPPTAQTIKVTNIGTASLSWTATADQTWINLDPASGTAPTDVTMTVDVAGLTAGDHNAVITFIRTGDDPGPVTVAVALTLTEDTTVPPVVGSVLPDPGSKGVTVDGRRWKVHQLLDEKGVGINLRGVWGTGPRNIFVVGDNGTIRRFNGRKWKTMDTGGTDALYSVWGSAKDNVYVVGDAGTILHFDGKLWTTQTVKSQRLEDIWGTGGTTITAVGTAGSIFDVDTPPGSPINKGVELRSIWGSSAKDIYAVGAAGKVVHFDGDTWTVADSGSKNMLNSVWGRSDADIFVVGDKGTILHKDASGWTPMTSGTTENLLGIWGNSGKDVFAVGANGTVLQYNGTEWSTVFTGGENNIALNDVWAGRRSFVVAVGDSGTILTARKAKFAWDAVLGNIMRIAREKKKEQKKEQAKAAEMTNKKEKK